MSAAKPKGRGGPGRGQGRRARTTDGGPLVKKSVLLDAGTVDALIVFGEGILSEGIRRAAKKLLTAKGTEI